MTLRARPYSLRQAPPSLVDMSSNRPGSEPLQEGCTRRRWCSTFSLLTRALNRYQNGPSSNTTDKHCSCDIMRACLRCATHYSTPDTEQPPWCAAIVPISEDLVILSIIVTVAVIGNSILGESTPVAHRAALPPKNAVSTTVMW